MHRSRSFFVLVVSVTIGLLVFSTLGVVQPTSIALAEGNGPGGCEDDTCPPDTNEPSLSVAPTDAAANIVSLLLGWLLL
ncbi:MAG: hypothetical protein ABIJ61_14545 [bacterium]